MAEVFGHRLRAGADMELLVNVADMRVDGGVGEPGFLGNFLVEIALGEQVEHLCLPGRKVFGPRRSGRFLKRLNDFASDMAAHRGASLMHVADGGQQLVWGSLFEHVTGGSRRQRVENVLGVLVDGEHDDLRGGQERFEAPHALD